MKKSFQRVIATLNLFQGKQSLTIFMLAAIFALSACDDSSSASSDETGVSSSSVESSDSSVTLSGASAESNGSSDENMEKDKSSSSVKGSEPVEVSGSSAKETKNSSDSKSSSSVKTGNSSSSNKDVSSSSVRSSSSGNLQSSSSNKDSSSAKSSSSFEVDTARLCTPDYNLCNRPLFGDSIRSGAYKKFTDKRNGRTYFYLTINGKNKDNQPASVTVMAENLNVGEMIDGAMDQSSDLKIERNCYDNDSANCEEYGGLYQWAEMMQFPSECNAKSCADQIQENHQGICPNGWRLLTYDDFYIVVHADGNKNSVADVRAMGFSGHNYSGYSLIGAGYNWNHTFKNLNEGTYWFYPEESVKNADVATYSTNQNKYSSGFSRNEVYKTHGFSVRCVKLD
ncbi:FISUMP domain-containing protein [Fibrobacter sp.]|uniref:FISUMP domain-containing protein n=1 Tax=Fibrobacter sp. TaxID=35828 RepID=UPI0025BC51F7|nr:FISUMP domain-containing protein [Fibrobacter sp.]MBR4008558.1 hypothetical protein [Fibrobacter sp.]